MNNISVSTLVRYLKNKLDGDSNLQGVLVSGELSNFHKHSSGHLYFTLKDEKSAISCVMFSSKASHLKFMPKNGDKVLVSANTSLFETSGQLQLYINTMKLDGIGDLYAQYEELKNKLAKEGIFSDEHKKVFTLEYPKNVAVLVGGKSAAMSDIKTQFSRRWPLANVDYYPVLVQGNDAPKDIINNLLKVDSLNYDYIILARGGGSFEDLFCFNDESLVRTIYNLNTFIITGVGHEQDYTLVDFVSDLRAPTPTATVELTTPYIIDVLNNIKTNKELIKQKLNDKFNKYKDDLDELSNNKYFKNPNLIIDKSSLKLDYFNSKLKSFNHKIISTKSNINNNLLLIQKSFKNKLKLYFINVNQYNINMKNNINKKVDKLINDERNLKNRLLIFDKTLISIHSNINKYQDLIKINMKNVLTKYINYIERIKPNSSSLKISIKNSLNNIDNYIYNLNKNVKRKYNNYETQIDNYSSLLKAHDISSSLKRGYSIIYKEGKIINNINNLNINDELNIKMYNGHLTTIIKEKK